jgi:hypothetical protein
MSVELASHIFVTLVLALMNVHFLGAGAPAYAGYRKRTGMFLPRIFQSSQRDG